MEATLARFVRALRATGARVSQSESIDAARAMAIVGYSDRDLLKHALAAALAKSEDEKQAHNALFDLFFRSRDVDEAPDSSAADTATDDHDAGTSESRPGAQPGDAAEQSTDTSFTADQLMAMAQGRNPNLLASAMERAAMQVGVDDIRFQTQTAYYGRQMLLRLGIEELEARLLAHLTEGGEAGERSTQDMIEARSALQRMANDVVRQRFEIYGRAATDAFMDEVVTDRHIVQLSLSDMTRMKAIVARLAKRLADKHSRRRKIRDRGRLDAPRTLRASAGYDGVPFEVVWKIRKQDRPRIVAICDVSGSVARYVRFLLLLLYALNEKVADLETFAFSARLADVSETLSELDFDDAMARILRDWGGGGTDYGQALKDLVENHDKVIDRRTTVLILGDGRSNHANPRLDLFREIADRAKRVVWLCPEPSSMWGAGDSCMLEYRPFCSRMQHCATAADLEAAIDEILLAYD